MESAGTTRAEKPTATAIVLTRTFAAPRPTVFAALTEPEHLGQWLAAAGMTLAGCEADLRTGGGFRLVFERPGGWRIEVRGAYEEVAAPSRFVYVETYDFSPLRVHVTTELDELEGRTVFRQSLVYASTRERDEDFDGVATSSAEAHAKLDRYLEGRSPDRPSTP